jgi:hypothetical protein
MKTKQLSLGLLVGTMVAVLAMPVSAGLLAYYPFEDGTAGDKTTLPSDASGNGHDAVSFAPYGTEYQPGHDGMGMQIYRAGGINIGTWDPGTTFSVTLWSKEMSGQQTSMILTKRNGFSAQRWSFFTGNQDANGDLRVERSNGLDGSQTAAGTTVPDEWNHYAMTMSDNGNGTSAVKLYINGVDTPVGGGGAGTIALDPALVGAQLTIGAKEFPINTGVGYHGRMDELAIWDTALTSAQINSIMVNGVPEPSSIALLVLGGLSMLVRRRNA